MSYETSELYVVQLVWRRKSSKSKNVSSLPPTLTIVLEGGKSRRLKDKFFFLEFFEKF